MSFESDPNANFPSAIADRTQQLRTPQPIAAGDLAVQGLDLYITTTCDRRCDHCFLTDSWLDSGQEMGLDMVSDIVDWATAPKSDITEVTLLGGEPSRHSRFPDLVRMIGAAELDARVVTNGSPAFRKALQTNADLVDIITRTSISIDAPDETSHDNIRGRGTFGWTLATAALLQEKNMPFDVNCTVLADNVDKVADMISFTEDLGANRLNIHWYTLAGRGRKHAANQVPSPDQWKTVLDVVSERRETSDMTIDCELGYAYGLPGENLDMCAVRDKSNLQISPDGTAMACGMLAERPELSGYVWKDSGLYHRSAPSDELALTSTAPDCGGCPLRTPDANKIPVCIYNRLGQVVIS